MMRHVLLAFVLASATTAMLRAQVVIEPNGAVVSGYSPNITIRGLQSGEMVRIHALGSYGRGQVAEGKWVERTEILHAWVDVRADRRGIVSLDTAPPVAGTYTSIDGRGLLWSMRRPGDAALQSVGFEGQDRPPPAESTRIVVERRGQVVAEGLLRFVEAPGITVEVVADGDVNGTFAAPRTARRAPTLILLHGSEGASNDGSRRMATLWAGLGYAAFALNYFAYDDAKVAGVPRNVHVNQPIEMLAKVRDWLARRSEVDVDRLGLYGHSKGAEFAEVAAVRFPWVRAVVACVPSDVVWEGYGFGNSRNNPATAKPAVASSWSWNGEPLPYVALRPSQPPALRDYFDNTERYERSRADDPARAEAAAIPLEKTRARVLLLGGGRDEVWASGQMATKLAERMRRARRSDQVELHVFPRAGHQICGAGTFPTHLYGEPSTDPRVKDLVAEGEGASEAWRLTQLFFSKHLDAPATSR
jgi:dienelactone hydrolase